MKFFDALLAKAKDKSPELMLVGGCAMILGGAIYAIAKTRKANEILDKAKEDCDVVNHQAQTDGEVISEDVRKKTVVKIWASAGAKVAANYAIPTAITAGGFALIFGSHGIMKKRNVAMAACAGAMDRALKEYRKRVREELGEDKDKHFLYGLKEQEIEVTETNAKGKEKTVTKKVNTVDDILADPFSRFFDETSSEYMKNAHYNKKFLLDKEREFTRILQSRHSGVVTINEVYRALGLPEVDEGMVVGWSRAKGDDFVSFGLEEVWNTSACEGYEPIFLLTFNHAGTIFGEVTNVMKHDYRESL